ncbi:MAG: exostosin family protein [Granulosicoccus sp.]
MKLFLTSAYDSHAGLDTLLNCVKLDIHKNHIVCDDPGAADVILFVENTQFDDVFFKLLSRHPLLQEFPDKVLMYNEMDHPWDFLPGLYCCMPRRFLNKQKHRAFAYLSTPNPYISNIYQDSAQRQWLYSFMGSMSHACRRPIMRLQHVDGYVQDTSDFNVWNSDSREMEVRGRAYANVLGGSQFVLCPRGIGTSSLRLYETLEAGRVPVIISDQWVPPEETDWSFAIQIEERRVSSIPGLLSALVNEAEERGNAARKAWSDSYAPNTLFNTVGNSIEAIMCNNDENRQITASAQLHKWLATGELLTRTAAQRLRGNY